MSATTPSTHDRSSTTTRRPKLKAVRAAPSAATRDLRPHPSAAIFPRMPDLEFRELCADIEANGLRMPITVHEGQILDGLNRWRACLEIGIEPAKRPWDRRGTVQDFVVRANLLRRNITQSQRAILAVLLVGDSAAAPGRPKKLEPDGGGNGAALHHSGPKGRTRDIEAAKWGVSPRLWADARKLVKGGNPELVKRVRLGELDIAQALRLAEWPSGELEAALELPADELPKVARKRRPERTCTEPGPGRPSTAAEPEPPAAAPAAVEPAAPPPSTAERAPDQAVAPKRPGRDKLRLQPRPVAEPGIGLEPGDTRSALAPTGPVDVPALGVAHEPAGVETGVATMPGPAGDAASLEAAMAGFRGAFSGLEEALRPVGFGDDSRRERLWDALKPFRERIVELLQSASPTRWAPCQSCLGKGQAHGRPCKKCGATGRGFDLD